MATADQHLDTAMNLHDMLEKEQVPDAQMNAAFAALTHNALLSIAASLREIRDLLVNQSRS